MAQAALESAWNSSAQALQDYNLFGIKADAAWHGAVQMWPTREVFKGASVVVDAPFRKYPDLAAGLEDHASFLTGNPRYQPAFAHTHDARAFAQAIADAGYATDPHYAQSIIAIIDLHALMQYDIAQETV
jgi:flagellum-specific peptidoglycan hydrolase FlgJ